MLGMSVPSRPALIKLLVISATMIAAPILLSYFSLLLAVVWIWIGIAHDIKTPEYSLVLSFGADVYVLTAYFLLLAAITRGYYPLLVWFLWLNFMLLMLVRYSSPSLYNSVFGSLRYFGGI
jgi:hypothetical protein